MEASREHYHALARYPGHPDGDEDQAYPDLEAAPAWAEEQARSLRSNGYLVEEIDIEDDNAGVIREYHAAEADRTPVAILEVRSCREAGHL